MEPKIVSKAPFTVVGMKYRGKNEKGEIPLLWGELWPRSGKVKHRVDAKVAYGVAGNKDDATGEFDYVAGFEVEDAVDIPEGMASWELPAQTYAVFSCTLATLMETYQCAFKEWLPASEYELADGPEFELYDESFNPQQGRLDMFLYVPVKRP